MKTIALEAGNVVSDLSRLAEFRARLAQEHAAGSHAYLSLPKDEDTLEHVLRLAQSRLGRFRHLVLIGIGGSSLGLRALVSALERPSDTWNLHVVDSTDPWLIADVLSRVELPETLFVAVSKSGTTLETIAALGLFEEKLRAAKLPLADHLVVITDPVSGPLRAFADSHGLESADIPVAVGGRFSVLSPAALLPAALLNIDAAGLVRGASRARALVLGKDAAADWASRLGLACAELLQAGRTGLMFMPYSARLKALSAWFVQLWDESLGKQGGGQTAIAAVGPADQHAQMQLFLDGPDDKLLLLLRVMHHQQDFTLGDFDWQCFDAGFLRGRKLGEILDKQLLGTAQACRERGRPVLTLNLPQVDAEILGELLMGLQAATSIAAMALNVNAYDQPAVELGKRISRSMLGG